MWLVASSLNINVEPDQLNVFYFVYQELMASGRRGRPRNEPEGPEEVMGMLREMAAAMREQAAAAHRMMERMEQRDEENPEGHNGGAEVDVEYVKSAEFQKANPPSFRGTYNPDRANEWVKAIEKIFTVVAYIEEQKVAFATYMLEANAKFWWVVTKRLLEGAQTHITWEISSHTFMISIFLYP